jgi:SOS-response transcriptional repressor LexA
MTVCVNIAMREWIESRLSDLGKTKSELSRHLGIPFARVAEIVKGKREVKSAEVIPMANFLNMNPVQLLTMLPDPDATIDQIKGTGGAVVELVGLEPVQNNKSLIPIRGEVAAGVWKQVDELYQGVEGLNEFADLVTVPGYPEDQQFALRVVGHSLNLIAPEGSTLHCVSYINGGAWDVLEGELVIIQHTKFQGQMIENTAKRIRQGADGWELCPESNHPDFQKPLKVADFTHDDCDDEIRVLAKVIGINRKP